MEKQFIKTKLAWGLPLFIFLAFSVWWLYIGNFSLDDTRNARQLWGATYQILALYGGIVGIYISGKWGGYKSMLGRVALAFSVGLFLQCFGQTFSSLYVYLLKVESPAYPSIGDIGFFGSVIAYIYGVIMLAKVSGIGVSLKKMQNKAWMIIIPVILLIVSYMFFLKGYEFDWSTPVKIFLDFAYPLGQALYVSIALFALLASRDMLGGIMKKPVLFFLFALLFQYFSDFFFLYQSIGGTWYVGNINDYLYCASYFFMAMSLVQLGVAFDNIKNS